MNNFQLDLFQHIDSGSEGQPASLIVVPTSLVHNWASEFSRFANSLRTYLHAGQNRKRDDDLDEIVSGYDVVLTTYGTIRNDIEMLRGINFHYIILDESQYVKNPSSKTYKAVMKLKGAHRLVLTGTPIENLAVGFVGTNEFFEYKGILGNQPFSSFFLLRLLKKHKR